MITLKLSAYSTKEKVALHQILSFTGQHIIVDHCADNAEPCEHCEYRHLCNDVFATTKHLQEEIRKEMGVQTV